MNSEQFWDLIFDLIRNGQNLPAISKVLDVPYRTLWGWINESEKNRQRYDEAREEQFERIRLKIDQGKSLLDAYTSLNFFLSTTVRLVG